jgi:hypothetical protein
MVLDSRIHILNIGLGAARRNCRKISCRPDFQIHILGRLAHCKFSSIVSRYQPPFIPLVAHRRPAASVVVLHRVPFTKSSEGSNSSRSAKQSRIFAFSRYNSKMIRTFAHFLLHKGTRESQFRPVAADFRSILSVENRGGAANPWGEGVALPTVTLSRLLPLRQTKSNRRDILRFPQRGD